MHKIFTKHVIYEKYLREIHFRKKLKRNCQISEISLIFRFCTTSEVKVSIPIKIDRNYQNNHIAANSLQFLSADQFLLKIRLICKSFCIIGL
jgi:hypothetical protein